MDRRDEILLKEFDVESEDCQTYTEDIHFAIVLNPDISKIKNAMDENGRQMCLDLLEYMAKNSIECIDSIKGYLFYYRGQYLTREQLFENFL